MGKEMSKLRIFTDGACSGNPGPGGWAALFLFPEESILMSSNVKQTTNNRMELMSVVIALEEFIDKYTLTDIDFIEINSDSAYVVNAVAKGWLWKWRENHWITLRPKIQKNWVKNFDLWKRLLKTFEALEWLEVRVDFVKVAGHSGIEFNEIVDEAARKEVLNAKAKIEAEKVD